MQEKELLHRIVVNPEVMVGKPIIRGTELPVEHILDLLAHETPEEIFQKYEGVTLEDIRACLLFASKSLKTTFFLPITMTGIAQIEAL